ncbi:TIGR02391 family protein [Pelomonas sp. CA6]|uniref:TIGR02391 family protein n=1 Tax=Pelomonas sp. CA6 TaxID=2907999 RepID=UPI001F4C17E2|nr:TIGR02391 family protein [Pelomonas sp. CA6]MCH7343344.1 TIGR02391 family protein [Pelomonas sp. CA6]
MFGDLGKVRFSELAAIQYHGLSGISRSCLDAIRRILQFGERPDLALLLTVDHGHAFLLCSEQDGDVAIKSGLSSGYRGEGPTALADALRALMAADIEIEEVRVSADLLERLELSALTKADLDFIKASEPVRPTSWYDYIYGIFEDKDVESSTWQQFPEVMPWHVIDERLNDLAVRFSESPDRAILDGFRRLEDRIRERLKSREHGTRLFSIAFAGDKPALVWLEEVDENARLLAMLKGAESLNELERPQPLELIDRGEQTGRAQLFTGAYQAFRNPRAHRHLNESRSEQLAEFLVLNQLFLLERAAVASPESVEKGEST